MPSSAELSSPHLRARGRRARAAPRDPGETVAEQTSRLEVQAAELRRSNHALEQFAYVISHDLQEPLRMVAAYTELLARALPRASSTRTRTSTSTSPRAGARRMQELINALLDYSRVTTRGKELHAGLARRGRSTRRSCNLSLAVEESNAEVIAHAAAVGHGRSPAARSPHAEPRGQRAQVPRARRQPPRVTIARRPARATSTSRRRRGHRHRPAPSRAHLRGLPPHPPQALRRYRHRALDLSAHRRASRGEHPRRVGRSARAPPFTSPCP